MKARHIALVLSIVLFVTVAVSCSRINNKHTSNSCEVNEEQLSGLGLWSPSYQKKDDWIYYVDHSTKELWRVSIDGTEKMKLSDELTNSFVLHEDRVYYPTVIGSLTSVRTDGSDNSRTLNTLNGVVGVRKMNVADEWIYAIDSNTRSLYKTRDFSSEYIWLDESVVDFCIEGEWIYYTKEKANDKYEGNLLWRMRTDGTQMQQLMRDSGYSLDYNEDCIYYKNFDDGDIYKVPILEMKGQMLVECDGSGLFLKVIGDWVYFEERGDKSGIYKVKKDGSERTQITTNANSLIFTVWDNWLLCIDPHGDHISAIKVSESQEKTDDIIKKIIEDWPNAEIYE